MLDGFLLIFKLWKQIDKGKFKEDAAFYDIIANSFNMINQQKFGNQG